MSGVSLPVTRPVGRALLVGSAPCRVQPLVTLQGLGFACAEADDPYVAMRELCRRPLIYRALILSLSSLYREELQFISAVRRRFPHIEIWLAHTDGRQASLADGMCLGADGLLAEDGLHRIAMPETGAAVGSFSTTARATAGKAQARLRRQLNSDSALEMNPDASSTDTGDSRADDESSPGEPVLTADELRALLQDSPAPPPSSSNGAD